MPAVPPPQLSICAGAASRRQRISCRTGPRHSPRRQLYRVGGCHLRPGPLPSRRLSSVATTLHADATTRKPSRRALIMTPALYSMGERLQRLQTTPLSSCDYQRPLLLCTCRRIPSTRALSPGASTRRLRFKNPLQYTYPTRSSRMKHPQDPKTMQQPIRVSLRASPTSSNDPSICKTRIKLCTPLPHTSLASATHVFL